MKKFLLLCALCAVSVGCENSQKNDKLVSNILKTYEITSINRPKHFYVDIKDVDNGKVYPHQYVSKHCNAWRKLVLGSRWSFQEVIYENNEGVRRVEIHGLRTKLCEKLSKMQ